MARHITHQVEPNKPKNVKRDPIASGERDATVNRAASHNYYLEDRLETGIVLTGSEVKSVRAGRANLKDGYALLKDGELPRIERALTADAVGMLGGSLLGTSPVTSYIESGAGVGVGARTGLASVVTGDVPRPNGLAFSPDESRLYVVASGDSPRTIRVFDVVGNGTALANGRVFVDCGQGVPDGFRCDTDGNLWCGWGGGEGHDGVVVFTPDGTMVFRILLPERCANLCFGGPSRNRLFMAASQSIYSVYVDAQGATLS